MREIVMPKEGRYGGLSRDFWVGSHSKGQAQLGGGNDESIGSCEQPTVGPVNVIGWIGRLGASWGPEDEGHERIKARGPSFLSYALAGGTTGSPP